jgi:hypothetical protein
MHSFICKTDGDKIIPIGSSKKILLDKLKKDYKDRNITFKVTVSIVEKNLNKEQVKLHKAFILKAADHFGTTYPEMLHILERFTPDEGLSVERWSTKELDTFINKSTAFLAEHGFNF